MKKAIFFILFIMVLSISSTQTVPAQCAMCTISAEQGASNGNTHTKGLNTGVLYLMSIPYLLIAGLGALWYFKYRKKTTPTV